MRISGIQSYNSYPKMQQQKKQSFGMLDPNAEYILNSEFRAQYPKVDFYQNDVDEAIRVSKSPTEGYWFMVSPEGRTKIALDVLDEYKEMVAETFSGGALLADGTDIYGASQISSMTGAIRCVNKELSMIEKMDAKEGKK